MGKESGKAPKCQVCDKENHNGLEWCGPCLKAASTETEQIILEASK